MKPLLALIVSLAAASLFGKPTLVGTEPDLPASALVTSDLTMVNSASRAMTTEKVFTLIGCEVGHTKNWPKFAVDFVAALQKQLADEHWKIGTCWDNVAKSGAGLSPRQIYFTGTRADESLEIAVTLIPEADGRVNIAYSQRRGR